MLHFPPSRRFGLCSITPLWHMMLFTSVTMYTVTYIGYKGKLERFGSLTASVEREARRRDGEMCVLVRSFAGLP